jgi:hypothetical protein
LVGSKLGIHSPPPPEKIKKRAEWFFSHQLL